MRVLAPNAGGAAFRLLLAGALATFACGVLIWLGEVLGLMGAKPITELLAAVVLLKIYPEKAASWKTKRVVGLISIGVGLGLFWVVVFAWGNTGFPDLSTFSRQAIFTGVLSAVVTAPLYEEKVVRQLLLQGAAGFVNPWIAAIFVSIMFAAVHRGALIWSFIVSMTLCWLVIVKGIGTLQRALVHGVINSLVMLWYFTSGFGFFG
jgi:membrane protease YdiL (CAAX protease family)